MHRANANTLPVVALLAAHPSITHVRHPSTVPTAALYRRHQRADGGGEGQVLSVVFRGPHCAEVFCDTMDACKGTSFGTNFTLCIPFVGAGALP
jgi:cystathionine gamma-synthase